MVTVDNLESSESILVHASRLPVDANHHMDARSRDLRRSAELRAVECSRIVHVALRVYGRGHQRLVNHGTDPRHRMALMKERVEAMKAIWTQEEASYSGTFVSFDRCSYSRS